MADKIDTSVEEEAIKEEARNFMSDALGGAGAGGGCGCGEWSQERQDDGTGKSSSVDGAEIVKAWKSTFAAATKDNGNGDDDNDNDLLMNKFWSIYDTDATSIWTMIYDEADSNENLNDTIEIVTNLMKQSGMSSMNKNNDCFAIVHTLESLEIEGLWFFNGPDPEKLFGANEETSWFSWSQLGPDATDLVMEAVTKFIVPIDNKLDGKVIKNTTVF